MCRLVARGARGREGRAESGSEAEGKEDEGKAAGLGVLLKARWTISLTDMVGGKDDGSKGGLQAAGEADSPGNIVSE